MKKFTKLFLSCAAVAAITAAVATSAMAADITGEVTGTYADGKVTLTNNLSDTCTVLVLGPGYTGTTVSENDILYIDQVDNGDFGDMGLKGGKLDEPTDHQDTYTVKVGTTVDGAFKVLTGTFKLGTAAAGGEDIVLGEVTGDTDIQDLDSGDANAVLWYSVNPDSANAKNAGKAITLTDGKGIYDSNVTTIYAGEVTGDTDAQDLDSGDANAILWYSVNPDSANAKNAGKTVVGSYAN